MKKAKAKKITVKWSFRIDLQLQVVEIEKLEFMKLKKGLKYE